VWRSAISALVLSVPVILLLAFFSSAILDLLGGNSFRSGAALLILLAAARAISIAAPPIASALIAMGQPSRSIGVNLASNLLLFPVLLLLLSWRELDGSGYHAVIQAACSTGLLALLFRRSAKELS
jgi:O-antigen/teichoic acid export membrane protein